MALKQLLLTPGPLNCSARVKVAMLTDYGSRSRPFIDIVRHVRDNLLRVGQFNPTHYTSVLVPGSGTTAVEATFASIRPHKLAIFSNGTYGLRMAQIAGIHRLETIHVNQPSNIRITPALVHQTLKEHPDITHAALVHHETTTGILNPVRDIQAILRDHSVSLIVDAMSSFGGIPMDFQPDFLISSANKCLESVPGCAFVIATRSALARTHQTPTHSLTTTLHPLWKSLETTGQFLYTPPTNVIAALDIALSDTLAEGVSSRNARYRLYNDIIRTRMRRMGIVPYLEHHHGPIITTFRYPTPDFDFQSFYNQLAARGVTLYPGVTDGVFRIGNIGHLSLEDIQTALTAIEHVVRGLTLSIEEGVFAHPM